MALCRNDCSSHKELLPAAAQEARGKKQEARGKKQGAPRRAQKEELGGRGLVDRGSAGPGGRGRRQGLVQGSRDKAQASVAQDRDSCLDRPSAPPPPPPLSPREEHLHRRACIHHSNTAGCLCSAQPDRSRLIDSLLS